MMMTKTTIGLCAGIGLLTVASAQAQELRYSTTTAGGITAAGNTLGLSNAPSSNGPGINGSIGTFIAANASDVDTSPVSLGTPWGSGTTNDWTRNGSDAVLDLPDASEILYAELVWSGSYQYGGEDLSAQLNTPVTLAFGSDNVSISPDPISSLTISETGESGFAIRYYIRSAEVTSFVASHGAGAYEVRGVPATQTTAVNTLNAAGWTLVVAYQADSQPIRNLSVFVGGSFVDEDDVQDYEPEGFCAPPFGPVEGRVVVSAVEGDANLTGDGLAIGTTTFGSFVSLSGPNNPATNVFASQINNDFGLTDTRGSVGSVNHNAFAGTNTVGGRQGWDLTSIELSDGEGHLQNAQTSAILRTQTEGDSFLPVLLAFEIDANAPDFSLSNNRATPSTVEPGDTLTVTAILDNSGEAPARDVMFQLDVDSGLFLQSYTTDGQPGDANGSPVPASRLAAGVPAGIVAVDEQVEVTLVFDVIDAPSDGDSFSFDPSWDYTFVTCAGESSISGTHQPPAADAAFDAPEPDTDVDTDPDTELDVEPDTDPPTDTGEDLGFAEGGACGCSTGAPSVTWGFIVMGLLGLRRRRTAAQ